MDMERFRRPGTRGVILTGGDDLFPWRRWAAGIAYEIRQVEAGLGPRDIPDDDMLAPVLAECARDVEGAIHVVAEGTAYGATRTHVEVLRSLAGIADLQFPDLSDAGDRPAFKVARVLGWYEGLCREPAPSVTVREEFHRHAAPGVTGGAVELLAAGDGIAVRVMRTRTEGSEVVLDRAATEEFLARTAGLCPEGSRRLTRGAFFLGQDDELDDGTRLGLRVATSVLGEPLREVVSLAIQGPGWATYAETDLHPEDVDRLLAGVRDLLDRHEPAPAAPAMR